MTRVVVTGAAGFLGSHLVEALVRSGHTVVGIDNLRRGQIEHLAQVDTKHFELHLTDVRDYACLSNLFQGAEVVYHLAAQSSVMNALEDIDYSMTTNVNGTCNVLRAACDVAARRVVFASSREVYGEPASLPVREDAPLLAKNPYGASKVAGEAYCRAWQESYGLDCQVLRFGNLYGPRDSDRVIPLWLKRASAGEDLVIYGGDQVLDFLWVDRAVEALQRAADCHNVGPINVAGGQPTTLVDLATRILASFESSGSRLVHAGARNAEVTCFTADVKRMRNHLGVDPGYDPLSHVTELAESYARTRQGSGESLVAEGVGIEAVRSGGL